jgi:2,4-dienoyl-CoA reductase-like NADH-dependent reductase (Old Yellow Enzyme family)/NADPH-dependent 2,4-dienoyl-CoA reductase/sulfur reductase-like enzyme
MAPVADTSTPPDLDTPLRVGGLTLRGRIVFAAHLTNFAVDGLATERHAAYYAARAAGGAGLVVTEEHTVHPGDRPYEKLIRGYDPAALPGYRRLTDAVHAHGVPVLAQLNHNGGQSSGMYSRQPVWAPSAVPDRLFREVPVAVTAAQITELISGYAEVAARCVAGGFDGVELQCSQSSIVRQFLSQTTNHRADDYGGSPAGRARFLLELLTEVRAALGPDRVLGLRLGCDDLPGRDKLPGCDEPGCDEPGCDEPGCDEPGRDELPGPGADDTGLADVVEVARLVAGTGRVDYLNTAVGVAGSTQYRITPPMGEPAGYALELSAALRAATGLPVIGIGRFTTPAQARRALADRACDLVGVVRGQLADPEFAGRAVHGEPVRTCLGCNQECVARVGMNRWLGCVRNPGAGRESVPVAPPAAGQRVLVVGGGPAGLRAAATAAARGHRVTLCERAEVTGGQVLLAASAPGRAEFGQVVAELLTECARLGVAVRTGIGVDAAFVRRFAPDVVVLATGSRPAPPEWAVPGVVDVRDVLAGRCAPAGRVLVYDELGFHQATSVAELLAARGCAVEVMTPALVVGQDLGLTLDRERFRRRAAELGLRRSTDRVVLGASAAGGRITVEVLHHPTGVVERREFDAVVCALPGEPEDELWRSLGAAGPPVHRVGDCLAPRRLDAAIIEGDRVGRLVGRL